MTCGRHEPMLLLHAHGQLQGYRRRWLDAHLHECSVCRGRWARWVVERDVLRRSLSAEPDIDRGATRLMDAVASRIRSESPRSENYIPQRRPLAWLHELLPLAGTAAVILSVSALVSAMAAFWEPPHPVAEAEANAVYAVSGTEVHACPLCGLMHRPEATMHSPRAERVAATVARRVGVGRHRTRPATRQPGK
jgi:anti-sigma factor RsiW